MDFVATTDFSSPYVIATGQPHKPTKICTKKFKKGDIITGEIKTVKGKPSFVLHKGVMVIPFSCIKQVITKDIEVKSSFAAQKSVEKANPKVEVKVPNTSAEKKRKVMDGAILGAILGFGATILAEKQGWISGEDKKTRIYGSLAGAFLVGYFIYRSK
jgi:hypothetical protein